MIRQNKNFILIITLICGIFTLSSSDTINAQIHKEVDCNDISIPHELGIIQSRYKSPTSQEVVVFIQDTHTSYSAQKNIASILDYLHSKYNINIVAIEGSQGRIDTSEFSCFPDKSVKLDIAEYFLRKGIIDGSEYRSIVEYDCETFEDYIIYGVEIKNQYNSNFYSYLRTVPTLKKLKTYTSELKEQLQLRKEQFYHKELFLFDSIAEQYHQDKNVFNIYIHELKRLSDAYLIDNSSFKTLLSLFRIIDREKAIDFSLLDMERFSAIKELCGLLPENLAVFIRENELKFQSGKIGSTEYNLLLNSHLSRIENHTEKYPNLTLYLSCFYDYNNLDNRQLLNEMQALENTVYSELINNSNEEKIFFYSQLIYSLERFSNLLMTREYLAAYRNSTEKHSISELISYLNESSNITIDETTLFLTIDSLEQFYEEALTREENLAENTISLMRSRNANAVAFIAGGFHTDGICNLLRNKNISHIVITPQIKNDKNQIPYLSLLHNFRTSLDNVIATYTSTLKMASWMTSHDALPLVYQDRKRVFSYKMKTLLVAAKILKTYTNISSGYPEGQLFLNGDEIAKTLSSQTSDILNQTGYKNTLVLDSIQVTEEGILIGMKLKRDNGELSEPLYIYLHNNPAEKPYLVSENTLETVALSPTINIDFIDNTLRAQMFDQIRTIHSKILLVLGNSALTFDEIYSTIGADTKLPENTIKLYLNSLQSSGIIRNANGLYSINPDSDSKLTAFVAVDILKSKYDRNRENGVINVNEFPLNLKTVQDTLNILKIGSLVIDLSLPINELHNSLKAIQNISQDQMYSQSFIKFSENAVAHILKPSGSEKFIIHVSSSHLIQDSVERRYISPTETLELEIPSVIPSYSFDYQSNGIIINALADIEKIFKTTNIPFTLNNLTEEEKSALIHHVLKQAGLTLQSNPSLTSLLLDYFGIKKPVTPLLTHRVGVLISNNKSFIREYNKILVILSLLNVDEIDINPQCNITPQIETKVVTEMLKLYSDSDTSNMSIVRSFDINKLSKKYNINTAMLPIVTNIINRLESEENKSGQPLTLEEFLKIISTNLDQVPLKSLAYFADEKNNLLIRTKLADSEAREQLVKEYTPLVKSTGIEIAKIIEAPPSLDFGHLFSYGYEGILVAAEKTDLNHEVSFPYFAKMIIKQKMIRGLREILLITDNKTLIRSELRENYRKANGYLKSKLQRSPTNKELADFLNIPVKKVIELKIQYSFYSLDEPFYADDDEQTIPDRNNFKPSLLQDEMLIQKETAYLIRRAIQLLTPREQDIVRLHFFESMTMPDISEIISEKYEPIEYKGVEAIYRRDIKPKLKNIFELMGITPDNGYISLEFSNPEDNYQINTEITRDLIPMLSQRQRFLIEAYFFDNHSLNDLSTALNLPQEETARTITLALGTLRNIAELVIQFDNFELYSMKNTIVEAIHELVERDQLVMMLEFYDGLEINEIARIIENSDKQTDKIRKRALGRVKKKFLEKFQNDKYTGIFANQSHNFRHLVMWLTAQVNRSDFNVPDAPEPYNIEYIAFRNTGKQTELNKAQQSNYQSEQTLESGVQHTTINTDNYTKSKINEIFEEFQPDNPKSMINYLNYFSNHTTELPSLLSVFKNPYFKEIYKVGASPAQVYSQLESISQKAGFSSTQTAQLQNIFERINYVSRFTPHKDVIVIDFDALGLSYADSSAKEYIHDTLQRLINSYYQHQRAVELVFVSNTSSTQEIRLAIGDNISKLADRQVYGKEMINPMGTDKTSQYAAFLLTVARDLNVNRVNLKVFSNNNDMIDTALALQTICANRTLQFDDAMKIFANLHHDKIANLKDLRSGTQLQDILSHENNEYFTLSGKEITLQQAVPLKIKSIYMREIIDTSA